MRKAARDQTIAYKSVECFALSASDQRQPRLQQQQKHDAATAHNGNRNMKYEGWMDGWMRAPSVGPQQSLRGRAKLHSLCLLSIRR